MRLSLDKHSPHLLKELDSEKNGSFNPSSIGYSSTKKVWWKCNKGHSYYTSIGSRTRDNGTGCPYCSNQKVLKGFNDLKTKRPDIAKEWDYEKNYPLKPSEILPGTQKNIGGYVPKIIHIIQMLIIELG